MWFESELFAKCTREGGKKHTRRKKNTRIQEKVHFLLVCVFPAEIVKSTREVTQTIQFILNGLITYYSLARARLPPKILLGAMDQMGSHGVLGLYAIGD